MRTPRTYLATSGGLWRLIQGGAQVSRDWSTQTDALRNARAFRVRLLPIYLDQPSGHWHYLALPRVYP